MPPPPPPGPGRGGPTGRQVGDGLLRALGGAGAVGLLCALVPGDAFAIGAFVAFFTYVLGVPIAWATYGLVDDPDQRLRVLGSAVLVITGLLCLPFIFIVVVPIIVGPVAGAVAIWTAELAPRWLLALLAAAGPGALALAIAVGSA